jgi:hypothetical protein
MRLAERWNWALDDETTVFQFKAGLSKVLVQQLAIAEANWILMANFGATNVKCISVEILEKMVLQIEANQREQLYSAPSSGASAGGGNGCSGGDGGDNSSRRFQGKCNNCGRWGHKAVNCKTSQSTSSRKCSVHKLPGGNNTCH